jgi:threonyl-tRNA synthetase
MLLTLAILFSNAHSSLQPRRITVTTEWSGRDVFIVVGQEELDSRSVNVRNRDDVGTKAKTGMVPLDVIIDKLVRLKTSKSLQNALPE